MAFKVSQENEHSRSTMDEREEENCSFFCQERMNDSGRKITIGMASLIFFSKLEPFAAVAETRLELQLNKSILIGAT